MICGAKAKHGGFCRHAATKGRRRCRLHGGNNYGPIGKAHGWHQGAWDARARLQAQFKRMGIPWYGGRLRAKRVLSVTERAIAIADQATEVIERTPENVLPVVLRDAMLDGLVLGRTTVRAVQIELEEAIAKKAAANAKPGRKKPKALVVDEKLLRLGNDTGMALCRLGMRAIEGEFKKKNTEALSKLLGEIARARQLEPPEK